MGKSLEIIQLGILIVAIVGLYGGFGYFLITTDKVLNTNCDINIKITYFLLAILFGAILALTIALFYKTKGRESK